MKYLVTLVSRQSIIPRQCLLRTAWDVLLLLSQDTIRNVLGIKLAPSGKRPLKASLALTRDSLAVHSRTWSGERRFDRSSME